MDRIWCGSNDYMREASKGNGHIHERVRMVVVTRNFACRYVSRLTPGSPIKESPKATSQTLFESGEWELLVQPK